MEYVKVAGLTQVADGELVPVEAKGHKLLLTRVGETVYVTQRKCPHLGFNLCRGKVEEGAIVCPLHKARFNLETGAIEQDPRLWFIGMKAKNDLQTYPVRIEGGEILVGL